MNRFNCWLVLSFCLVFSGVCFSESHPKKGNVILSEAKDLSSLDSSAKLMADKSASPHPPEDGFVLLAKNDTMVDAVQNEMRPFSKLSPSFELIDQSAQPFESGNLRGKVWIASFIFTRCKSACPLLTGQMAEFQKKLKGSRILLVSFSVDPDYDSPQVLKEYAAHYGAEEGRWFFLTGKKEEIRELMSGGFELGVADATAEDLAAGAEPVMHSNRFVLVDKGGLIRGYYDSQDPASVKQIIKDALNIESHAGD